MLVERDGLCGPALRGSSSGVGRGCRALLSVERQTQLAKVLGEKGEDAPPGVLRGRMVVAKARDMQQRCEEQARVEAVHKAVTRFGVLLDIVRDVRGAQRLLETLGAARKAAVAGAVAGDDRTRAFEPLCCVLGDLAVVN